MGARLVIADDHALVREGIRTMLAGEGGLEVVGEAEDGREAVELCRRLRPDLVLMDVRMPKMDGIEATRAIKRDSPDVSVLMVTSHGRPGYLREAIKAGAAGYVLKEATKRQLTSAIREALSGEFPFDRDLSARLLRELFAEQLKEEGSAGPEPVPELAKTGPGEVLHEALTPRELDVLRLLARGQTNREISRNLSVAVTTVKNHVQRVISKLGVSDRTQAAVKAIRLGLISDREET